MKPNQFFQKLFMLYVLVGVLAVASITGCKKEDIQPPSDDETSTTTSSNAETTPPTVSFTFPHASDTLFDSVTIIIQATDNVGVQSVQLKIDGVVIGTKTTAPYNFGWNTKTVMNGSHKLSAKAVDVSGNSKTKNITVNTLNADFLPIEKELVNLINADRIAKGIAPVKLNSALLKAAREHSTDMAKYGYLAHGGHDGSTLQTRLNAAGYPWTFAGENLAAGLATAKAVYDSWAADSAKRSIFEDARFEDIGVGCAYTSAKTATFHQYWTMDIGTTH
jgi:uncharacterized protein YkwD